MRKILVSPGFGAGWSSWAANPQVAKYMLEYEPIIKFLEAGGRFDDRNCGGPYGPDGIHPLLQQLIDECQEKFGSSCYTGGARDLMVVEVDGPVRIREYDGSESYETPDSIEWS